MAAKVVLTENMVESAATRAAQQLGYTSLKPEQLQAVAGIVRSHDTFVVLPTGYGKTLCYVLRCAALEISSVRWSMRNFGTAKAYHCLP